MTDWKLIHSEMQIDDVGNIYQKQGGVNPKACQKCKTVFKTETKKEPIIKPVTEYKCGDCEYHNFGADGAFTHMMDTKHNINKKITDKIVNYRIISTGNKPNIRKITDEKTKEVTDVTILCDDCK